MYRPKFSECLKCNQQGEFSNGEHVDNLKHKVTVTNKNNFDPFVLNLFRLCLLPQFSFQSLENVL